MLTFFGVVGVADLAHSVIRLFKYAIAFSMSSLVFNFILGQRYSSIRSWYFFHLVCFELSLSGGVSYIGVLDNWNIVGEWSEESSSNVVAFIKLEVMFLYTQKSIMSGIFLRSAGQWVGLPPESVRKLLFRTEFSIVLPLGVVRLDPHWGDFAL